MVQYIYGCYVSAQKFSLIVVNSLIIDLFHSFDLSVALPKNSFDTTQPKSLEILQVFCLVVKSIMQLKKLLDATLSRVAI